MLFKNNPVLTLWTHVKINGLTLHDTLLTTHAVLFSNFRASFLTSPLVGLPQSRSVKCQPHDRFSACASHYRFVLSNSRVARSCRFVALYLASVSFSAVL